MKSLSVILVDDNKAFRKAFKKLLENQFHATVIADVSSANEYMKLEINQKIDIHFIDIMMPDGDGIHLTKQILWKDRSLSIIAVTMYTENVYLTSLIEAGFVGCIFKNTLFEELPIAINSILEGKRYFPKNISINY
jgi:DNA-binding NarL/FixJ family response regulator